MKALLPLLLLCSTLAHGGTARPVAPVRELHYSFDLRELTRIHVTLEFWEREPNAEVLLLPSQWAGQTELYRAVSRLRVSSPGASLLPTSNPARWIVETGRAGRVVVAYDLTQDWSGPLKHPLEHRAVLEPTLFEFTGENGLVAPRLARTDPVRVTFSFSGLREGQRLVTSFGAGSLQHFEGRWSEVRNALFTGGEMSVNSIDVEGRPVLLAMHGAWRFEPGEIAPTVRRILRTERHLWNDTGIPYYAIVIAPYEEKTSGGGGSGFTNIFNLFLGDGEAFSTEIASLLAHEAFHEWNPSGLGQVDDTQRIAWFGEGFTSFYQDAVLQRSGVIEEGEYLERLNRMIREYLLSSRIHMTNADLQRVPASDRSGSEEPYLRGAMIALWLGSEMERQSGGRRTLSDLLLALREERSEPLTEDRIFRTAGRFVGRETVAQLRSFALDGVSVPVDAGSLGECVALSDRPAWTFDLGFDAASLRRSGTVEGVQLGSNAYEAGVRDGQRLGGYSLWKGNAEREVTLTLREADGRRERLSFLPQGKLLYVPQAEVIPGCKQAVRPPE